MTSSLYGEWIRKWDRKLDMTGRKILLLQDNFSGHIIPDDLQNIWVQNFEPNLTLHVGEVDPRSSDDTAELCVPVVTCVPLSYSLRSGYSIFPPSILATCTLVTSSSSNSPLIVLPGSSSSSSIHCCPVPSMPAPIVSPSFRDM